MSTPTDQSLIAALLRYVPAEGGDAQVQWIPQPPQLDRRAESAVHRVTR
jgi:hypothetical protein